MRTGIIGRGNIGGTIARKLAATDQTVKLAGRVGPEENRDQVEKIGALPVASSEAVKDVDAMR
jgi:predicted dinucleotide-binding enzyme